MKIGLLVIIAILTLGISCSSNEEEDNYSVSIMDKSEMPEWLVQKVVYFTQDHPTSMDIYKGCYGDELLYVIITEYFNTPEVYTSKGYYCLDLNYKELFKSKKNWTLVFTYRNTETPDWAHEIMNFWWKYN